MPLQSLWDLYDIIDGGMMMLSPDQLEKASAAVEEENIIFRTFLKGRDTEEVDTLVHELHRELFEDFDCVACSNCCKFLTPEVEEDEIVKLSSRLGLTAGEFRSSYLVKTEDGLKINEKPCPFLSARGCSVYSDRPANCREYPFTHKKEIASRLYNLLENCAVCPVVFEIFERLKEHYRGEFEDYKVEFQQMWGCQHGLAVAGQPHTAGKVNIGRNEPCPCGSGKKYKKCCG